jgi:hypothetical protein
MEMLQVLFEDTKNALIGECQIIVLYFLSTTNCKTQDYFTECNGEVGRVC